MFANFSVDFDKDEHSKYKQKLVLDILNKLAYFNKSNSVNSVTQTWLPKAIRNFIRNLLIYRVYRYIKFGPIFKSPNLDEKRQVKKIEDLLCRQNNS